MGCTLNDMQHQIAALAELYLAYAMHHDKGLCSGSGGTSVSESFFFERSSSFTGAMTSTVKGNMPNIRTAAVAFIFWLEPSVYASQAEEAPAIAARGACTIRMLSLHAVRDTLMI